MSHAKLTILALLFVAVAFAASAQRGSSRTARADVAAGAQLFHDHCSTCHGVDGKGPKPALSGPMATYDPQSIEPEKRVKPADLTMLSEENGGTFPAERVSNAINFKGSIPAHGTPEMPAWGNLFYQLKANPKALDQTVRNLTAYIESIQMKN